MEEKELPRLAFFSFTCCEGCQLAVLSCEDELPDILSLVKIVNFREAIDQKSDDYDIAFVEGSITRKEEVRKLKKIRKHAKIVVALGACSSTGGLNCLKNRFTMDEVKREVYGKDAGKSERFDTLPTRAIDEIIPVDYYLHGCPISKKEFLHLTTSLLLGKRPDIPNHPVCVECKMAGNICVFEKGMTCVGPITRAGCEAICVTYGAICWGCRGLVDNPNADAHAETLKRHGLTVESVMRKFSLYGACKTHKC
ncbi:MAG: NADH:ubiquinone oxidoreductase [Deltaproteobacteria bacterium]|nr:NADH:ubiquinone oxidoreductase [Deltaproteobacteria bacterium]